MVPKKPVRVYLVDDHDAVRRGVRGMIDSFEDLRVVGEADGAAAALEDLPHVLPDVAVLDVRLRDGNGIELCRDIHELVPHLPCVLFTSASDDDALVEAVLAGAAAYVPKQVRGTELVDTIRAVACGARRLDDAVVARVAAGLAESSAAAPQSVAFGVLELIGRGLTDGDIDEKLALDGGTARAVVHDLLDRVGLDRRAPTLL